MAFAAERGAELSEADREKLRRYSGFGGLKFILNPADSDSDKQYWKKSDQTYFDQTKELLDIIREGAKDEREAKELTDSIKRSVNTAFYTPQPVIGAIAKVMKDAGVEVTLKGVCSLEPRLLIDSRSVIVRRINELVLIFSEVNRIILDAS